MDFKKNFSITDFKMILDSIKDAIFIDDKNGITLWCNKACEQLYMIKSSDVIGIDIDTLEKRGVFSPSVAKIVLKEEREATIIHKNKTGQTLLSTGTPIFDENDNISKVITTSRDITELSSLQDKLQDVEKIREGVTKDFLSPKEGLIAESTVMINVLHLANRLANVDSTVLITGESGVGKGLISKYIHARGNRKDKPFITVNCGAIPENLIESELFGYAQGAFTGAKSDGKMGLFQAAHGGTVFLDEISELPINLQVKLLQVIQERFIIPVGSTEKIDIDVRILSATNKNLEQAVKSGDFREDLYYRLNVVPITVPPLRERLPDIPPLIEIFLTHYNGKYNTNKKITRSANEILQNFNWPGNIRELQNVIERLVLTGVGIIIKDTTLPEYIRSYSQESSILSDDSPVFDEDKTLEEMVNEYEKKILMDASKTYRTTRSLASALGVSQPTVVRKLQKYGGKSSDKKD